MNKLAQMVCIGVPKRHFLHFSHFPGCGEKWADDTKDGKCPICRGFLIPESMVGPQHKIDEKEEPKMLDEAIQFTCMGCGVGVGTTDPYKHFCPTCEIVHKLKVFPDIRESTYYVEGPGVDAFVEWFGEGTRPRITGKGSRIYFTEIRKAVGAHIEATAIVESIDPEPFILEISTPVELTHITLQVAKEDQAKLVEEMSTKGYANTEVRRSALNSEKMFITFYREIQC